MHRRICALKSRLPNGRKQMSGAVFPEASYLPARLVATKPPTVSSIEAIDNSWWWELAVCVRESPQHVLCCGFIYSTIIKLVIFRLASLLWDKTFFRYLLCQHLQQFTLKCLGADSKTHHHFENYSAVYSLSWERSFLTLDVENESMWSTVLLLRDKMFVVSSPASKNTFPAACQIAYGICGLNVVTWFIFNVDCWSSGSSNRGKKHALRKENINWLCL